MAIRLRSEHISVVGAAAGAAIGTILGGQTWTGARIGFALGSVAGDLFFQERRREIEVPDEKNAILSPSTQITSNIPIPLGFGAFFSAGNILDFAIERTYSYDNWEPDEIVDQRTYFIATGVSINPATIRMGLIGGLSFLNNPLVEQEFFPEGGKSRYPDRAQSVFSFRCMEYSDRLDDSPGSFDTDWVRIFGPPGWREVGDSSMVYISLSADVTDEEFAEAFEVTVYRRIGGKETTQRLTLDDWSITDHYFHLWSEENVEVGDYRITYEITEELRGKTSGLYIYIQDNDVVTLNNWAFQCNWFALKFSDDDFGPEDSTFYLEFDQGNSNPITGLETYMTNLEFGIKIADRKIDQTSFDALRATCDSEGREFNGLYTSQISARDIIEQFLWTAKALMVFSGEKFYLIEDVFNQPSKTFQESNTIEDSTQFSLGSVESSVSRLQISFEDSERNHVVRSVLLDDEELIDKIGIQNSSQNLIGVNTEAQALDIGAYLFRRMRQPGTLVLKASINDLDLEPGTFIEVIRPALQTGEILQVMEIQEEPNEEIQISGIRYFLDDERITWTTEDDFRSGTLSDVEITREEDGEVKCTSVAAPPPEDWLSLREHRTTVGPLAVTFEISGGCLKISTNGRLGEGIVFFVAKTSYLDGKKLAFKYKQDYIPGTIHSRVRVYDGSYDRSSDDDFPDVDPFTLKGAGVVQDVHNRHGQFDWDAQSILLDLSSSELEDVTAMVWVDVDIIEKSRLWIEYIQIRDPDDESVLVEFNTSSVTMEVSGTYKDYGYTGSGP
jgi:hypothetical protein